MQTPTITGASESGLQLRLDGEDLSLPFSSFPWFRHASMEQRATIERPQPDHLYWPLLDVDLSVETIRNPACCPLVSGRTGV